MARHATKSRCPPPPDTTYQGWKNYETWAVALWLDNDEGMYNHVRELAREAREEAQDRSTGRSAKGILADMIKDEIEEGAPELDGLFADLLNAALGEVDYYEIAEGILEE